MRFSTPLIVCGLLALSLVAIAGNQPPKAQAGPQLTFPSDYRQWVYLSSGLDMRYKQDPNLACKEGPCPPMFENVFVPRGAYDQFVRNKVWPIGTMFVLERRCSAQKVSIDTNGSTQGKLSLIAASQKTAENGWNYYLFGADGPLTCIGPDPNFSGQTAQPFSNQSTKPDNCWQCHKDNGLRDNTFIQFYPTLKALVPAKGM